ncbi:MAG: peptide-methionine (S)-S-oxide reductase [Planctomycetaceae bacterium]|nr:peptide-methionine (S)-S-oxide reductase [Planctomycetaceae bacterium]|tara:strand:+ start:3061 stop:3750 length:690 start_codon:yes stop_codon:yes gene_type:complete
MNKFFLPIFSIILAAIALPFSMSNPTEAEVNSVSENTKSGNDTADTLALATFGGGCFWCTEAVFEQFDGVKKVVSGYAGGFLPDPSYKDVCSGLTGHAEVVQVTYDPKKVSYPRLLEAFWMSHDPTTLNRQGNDVGTQYRSIVLYHDPEQKKIAAEAIRKLDQAKIFHSPIVTEIAPLTTFYPAEADHQNFYQGNKGMRYCQVVIEPKLRKIRKLFADDLQTGSATDSR